MVGMATGYAIATGQPALVVLHTTAGLGNAVGALATARVNRAPLVVLVGQQDRRHLAGEPFLAGRLEGLAGRVPGVGAPARPAAGRSWRGAAGVARGGAAPRPGRRRGADGRLVGRVRPRTGVGRAGRGDARAGWSRGRPSTTWCGCWNARTLPCWSSGRAPTTRRPGRSWSRSPERPRRAGLAGGVRCPRGLPAGSPPVRRPPAVQPVGSAVGPRRARRRARRGHRCVPPVRLRAGPAGARRADRGRDLRRPGRAAPQPRRPSPCWRTRQRRARRSRHGCAAPVHRRHASRAARWSRRAPTTAASPRTSSRRSPQRLPARHRARRGDPLHPP